MADRCRWTRAGRCKARWRKLADAGYGMKCGLEIEFHIYRITDDGNEPAA
jgi:hypothetical protein